MADRTTFFIIDRSLFENWIWTEKPFDMLHAWVYLIGQANYADKKKLYKGKIQDIKRGQLVTSYRKLAEDFGWSVNRVHRFINLLASDGMISVHSTSIGTVLTIENYSKFQDMQYADGHSDGYTHGHTDGHSDGYTHGHTDGHSDGIHNNKDNKENKDNNISSPPSREDVRVFISSLGLGFSADEFYDTYEETGWTDAKGNPIRNWKALCRKWGNSQPVNPYRREPTPMEKIMAEIKARKEAEQ